MTDIDEYEDDFLNEDADSDEEIDLQREEYHSEIGDD